MQCWWLFFMPSWPASQMREVYWQWEYFHWCRRKLLMFWKSIFEFFFWVLLFLHNWKMYQMSWWSQLWRMWRTMDSVCIWITMWMCRIKCIDKWFRNLSSLFCWILSKMSIRKSNILWAMRRYDDFHSWSKNMPMSGRIFLWWRSQKMHLIVRLKWGGVFCEWWRHFSFVHDWMYGMWNSLILCEMLWNRVLPWSGYFSLWDVPPNLQDLLRAPRNWLWLLLLQLELRPRSQHLLWMRDDRERSNLRWR